MKKKLRTAAEDIAARACDPAIVQRKLEFEQGRLQRVESVRAELASLLRELRAVNIPARSAADLKPTLIASHPRAASLIIEHLQKAYSHDARVIISRTLLTSEARSVWRGLVDLYRAESDRQVRSGLANAMVYAADDSVIGDVIDLVADPRYGTGRVLFLEALDRSAVVVARVALEAAARDSELREAALEFLHGTPQRLLPKRRPSRTDRSSSEPRATKKKPEP
ncbi:MAG: hypothetical protein ABI678_31415 [Kofleriaceae bacterium]